MLTNFHSPFHLVQIYFILLNIYYDVLHVILHPLPLQACPLFECRNSVIVRPIQLYLCHETTHLLSKHLT